MLPDHLYKDGGRVAQYQTESAGWYVLMICITYFQGANKMMWDQRKKSPNVQKFDSFPELERIGEKKILLVDNINRFAYVPAKYIRVLQGKLCESMSINV